MLHRDSNPYMIQPKEIRDLNIEVFPHWMEHILMELARKRMFEENRQKYGKEKYAPELKLLERLVFFLASKVNYISHAIPDFSQAINTPTLA